MSAAPAGFGVRGPMAGAVALLLGVGFGRYLFTPLITPLVERGWFDAHQTAQLGALNLLGYLLGALVAHRLAARAGSRPALAGALVLLTLSLAACMADWGFIWYGVWRLAAGVAAATLTIVATPAIMTRLPAARRPAASAIIFTGIGVGTMGTGLAVPRLAGFGIPAAWGATAAVAAALALWSWCAVWRHLPDDADDPAGPAPAADARAPRTALVLVIAAYGLASAGYVPHSLFWVDYIARELGRGLATGGFYWTLLGVGGVVGPAAAGLAAARLGFRAALVVAFGLMSLGTALPLGCSAPVALAASSVLVGAMVPAIITLTAGTVVELAPADRSRRYWGRATLAFAGGQAAGGFVVSHLYGVLGSYLALIGLGAVLLALGTACVVIGALRR